MGSWADRRLANLSSTDKMRDEAKNDSGFGKNVSNWVGKRTAYPTNVIHTATECSNVNHSAAFPVYLPSWFIKLFTRKGDIVLDPFMGSGTTAIAAIDLSRSFIGIESQEQFYKEAIRRIKDRNKSSRNKTGRSVMSQQVLQ